MKKRFFPRSFFRTLFSEKWCYFVLFFAISTSLYSQRDTLGSMDLRFVENLGQWEEPFLFRANLSSGIVFLEEQSMVINVSDRRQKGNIHYAADVLSPSKPEDTLITHFAYRISFIGSQPQSVAGKYVGTDYMNFYIGNDPNRWKHGVQNYERVFYENLYPHIDMEVYSQDHFMKYDFIVKPQGRVGDIALLYEGTNKLQLHRGNLVIDAGFTSLVELKPYAYQIIKGKTKEVAAKFVLKGNKVSYHIGDYDTNFALVIDPTLVFSTYTGSTADNWGFATTFDARGNIYAGGTADATGFPVSLGTYQTAWSGGWDIAIMKMNETGTQRLYATYLGSTSTEMPHSMIVNEFEELILLGTTGGHDFPTTPGVYCRQFKGGPSVTYAGSFIFPNGSDIFVCKLSLDGKNLLASTLIGGTNNDGLNYRSSYNRPTGNVMYNGNDSLFANYGDGARGEMITDNQNNIYVGSCTFSQDFPVTANAFQRVSGGKQDGIICKFDYELKNLIFSTYLGGSEDDAIFSIDAGKDYDLFVTGGTISHDFPTTQNAYSPTFNGGACDGFVARIAYGGNMLVASTYFGSDQHDISYFVRLDTTDKVYIFGQTKAQGSRLIHNATYNVPNSGQFIAKLSHDLSSREWSTVFGSGDGRVNIVPTAFAIDLCGRILAAGWGRNFKYFTSSFPPNQWGNFGMDITPDAFQSQTDGQDFYILSLAPDATALNYGSFIGENSSSSSVGVDHVDGGTSRFDKKGNWYQTVCASCGGHQGFPIFPPGGVVWADSNRALNCNNAIFKFVTHEDFAVADFLRPESVCLPELVSFVNTGRGDRFVWDFGDGDTSNIPNPTHQYAQPGVYDVTLTAILDTGCLQQHQIRKKVLVLGSSSHTLPDIYTCPGSSVQLGLPLMKTPEISIRWIPEEGLTNPLISDPFATVDQEQMFTMIISSAACSDTIFQWVRMKKFPIDLPADSIKTCHSPVMISPNNINAYTYFHWSSNKAFTDTLNIVGTSTASITSAEGQFYYVKVEKEGCVSIDSIYVSFSGLELEVTTTPALCFDTPEGKARVTVSGHVGAISYEWSTGDVTFVGQMYGLSAEQSPYWVKVIDSRGCHTTQTFSIPSPPKLVIHLDSVIDNRCEGKCTGRIQLRIEGGEPSYSTVWDNGSFGTNLQNLCDGTYICQVKDTNNCETRDTIQIKSLNTFRTSVMHTDNACPNACVGRAVVSASGGTEPYFFRWNTSRVGSVQNNLCKGRYSVEISDRVGCTEKQEFEVVDFDIFKGIKVMVNPDFIFKGDSVFLSSSPVIDKMSYQWIPDEHVTNPHAPQTWASPEVSTRYTVKISDNEGCDYEDTVFVRVEEIICGEPNIFVPNVFTPNGDGKNDILYVRGLWVNKMLFYVYNRWGERVFETKNLEQGWDGNFRGNPCEPGVYYYRLDVVCQRGYTYTTGGDITLIR